jgi:CheY-like chemotaxis protein
MTINIYYLDDEPALCAIFKEYLEGDGIKVTTFIDSSAAISICINEPPDMIFIDYRLADTTGEKVAQILDTNIPKVLVTGELLAPVASAFLSVIKKPYKLAELKQFIQDYFKVSAC